VHYRQYRNNAPVVYEENAIRETTRQYTPYGLVNNGVAQGIVLNGLKRTLHGFQKFHATPRNPLLVPRVRLGQIPLGLWSKDQFHQIIRD